MDVDLEIFAWYILPGRNTAHLLHGDHNLWWSPYRPLKSFEVEQYNSVTIFCGKSRSHYKVNVLLPASNRTTRCVQCFLQLFNELSRPIPKPLWRGFLASNHDGTLPWQKRLPKLSENSLEKALSSYHLKHIPKEYL